MTTATAPVAAGTSKATRHRIQSSVWGVVAWLAGIIFVFPVIWMLLTSLKQAKDVTTNPPVWFFTPTLDNFREVFFRSYSAGAEAVSSVRELGRVLFTDYVFAFEATSVLILVAMVGAVVIARRGESS